MQIQISRCCTNVLCWCLHAGADRGFVLAVVGTDGVVRGRHLPRPDAPLHLLQHPAGRQLHLRAAGARPTHHMRSSQRGPPSTVSQRHEVAQKTLKP